MFKYISVSSLVLASLFFVVPVQANIIMDTRLPKVYFSVDDKPVDRQYILRTEHTYTTKKDKEKIEFLFNICDSTGTCGYQGAVKRPERYKYFLEKMPEAVPENITIAQGYEDILKYYNEQKAEITLSVDVSDEIHAMDLKPSKEVVNYYVDIQSKSNNATVTEENLGAYDPLKELSSQPLTLETKKQLALPILVGIGILVIISIVAVKIQRSMSSSRRKS